MATRNTLRQIRVILYRLKRQFGLPGTLRTVATSSIDIQTGKTAYTYTDIPIKRIIQLPRKNISDFVYDLSFIAANKNFTYGGYFDINDRFFIIDLADLPTAYRYPNKTLDITTEQTLVIDSKVYKIYEAVLAEHDYGYLVKAREIVNASDVS